MSDPEIRYIRLDPPLPARVGGLVASATGLHPSALLVAWPPGAASPVAGETVRARVAVEGGELAFDAILEPRAQGEVALRFSDLDDAKRAQIETVITRHRKAEHIRIVRDEDVLTEGVTTGFERWRLSHEALPELDKRAIDLSTKVLGKPLRAPILISCMTGGSELAKLINRRLAAVAERRGLALGLGSQRAMLKAPALADTYAVRDLAPTTLLIGNVGAVQLNYGVGPEDVERLASAVGADAMALHLNPLQEAVQPEGDIDFSGLKSKIAALAENHSRPIILKEVGNGISRGLARWVASTRIAAVDTAGAGGTSWAKVESYRAKDPAGARLGRSFAGWGIPTAESLRACRAELPDRVVIASGGVTDGIEVAKAIALGADLVGLARPFLEAAAKSEEAVDELARFLCEQLRVAMFCCGAGSVAALRLVAIARIGGDDASSRHVTER